LIASAKKDGHDLRLLEQVQQVNKSQKIKLVEMLKKKLPDLKGKKIAMLGLAFKPNTDDVREAPAIEMIRALEKEGAKICAYDPQAAENMKKIFPDVDYASSPQEALENADACLLVTEWEEFKNLEAKDFEKMNHHIILEGRRCLSDKVDGVEGICW